jgi:hypothetical protein
MADITIERAPNHRHVLLAFGTDLFPGTEVDANQALVDALKDAVAESARAAPDALVSPLRPGTHDFWIVYSVGATGAANAGQQIGDASPRPLRGAVVAKAPPTSHDETTVVDQLTTLLQEVGHYWLAFPTLKFAWGGRVVPYELADWARFNHDQPLTGPLLGGRLLQHWGPWFHSEHSPLGGRNWSTVTREGVLDRWRWEDLSPGLRPKPPGLSAITVNRAFCDLDLLVMGARTADECYPETDGDFRYLEPTYVVQPRFLPTHPELDWPFLTGVFVAFADDDFVYFGFDGDHRAVGVYRTDRTRVTSPVDLGRGYTPAWMPNSGVALRVVRLGEAWHFQARFDGTALGLRSSPSDRNVFVGPAPSAGPGLFDGIGTLGPPASGRDFTTWRTVATLGDRRPAVAVGVIATTAWPTLLDAVFGPLETLTLPALRLRGTLPAGALPAGALPASMPRAGRASGSAGSGVTGPERVHTVHRLSPLPSRWRSGRALNELAAGDVWLDLPLGDLDPPTAQDWHGRLRMLLPYNLTDDEGVTFEHTATDDRAPKVLLRPPGGNFAFGTAVAVRRTLYPRYSGGGAYGTEIWGRTRTLNARDVRLPDDPEGRRRRPRNGQYRTAFVIAARQRSDITDAMIDSVDVVRRYWDPTFAAATDGLRRSDSTIP